MKRFSIDAAFSALDRVVDRVGEAIDDVFRAAEPEETPCRRVRILLDPTHMAKLRAGESLNFEIPDEHIEVKCG